MQLGHGVHAVSCAGAPMLGQCSLPPTWHMSTSGGTSPCSLGGTITLWYLGCTIHSFTYTPHFWGGQTGHTTWIES